MDNDTHARMRLEECIKWAILNRDRDTFASGMNKNSKILATLQTRYEITSSDSTLRCYQIGCNAHCLLYNNIVFNIVSPQRILQRQNRNNCKSKVSQQSTLSKSSTKEVPSLQIRLRGTTSPKQLLQLCHPNMTTTAKRWKLKLHQKQLDRIAASSVIQVLSPY